MREAALKHNVAATFMAKPMTGEPGSAMHLHQSIIDIATGKNIFSNEDGTMSQLFLHHIGGLQKFIPNCCRCSRPTSTRSAASCRTPRRR
jgi:glutamine synthetase